MFQLFKHEKRIQSLEEEIAKLKRERETLELEWINFFDKAKRMMGRIAKRADVVENAERQLNQEPNGEAEGALPPTVSPLWSKLTARQKQLQMSILNRRSAKAG